MPCRSAIRSVGGAGIAKLSQQHFDFWFIKMRAKKIANVLAGKRKKLFKDEIERSCSPFDIEKYGPNVSGLNWQRQLSSSCHGEQCRKAQNTQAHNHGRRRSQCSAASILKYPGTIESRESVFPGRDRTNATYPVAPAANPQLPR